MSRFKDLLAGKPNSGDNAVTGHKILINTLIFALLLAAVAGVQSGEKNSNQPANIISPADALVKSSCAATRYPKLCFSAIVDSLKTGQGTVTSTKDVILVSLKASIAAVDANFFAIRKLLEGGAGNFTRRERMALHDCLEDADITLDELHTAYRELEKYPSSTKSITRHVEDLKTLISSAITNQETCLDGFSHGKDEKHEREVFVGGKVLRVEKLCSNSLAMLTNLTDADVAAERSRLNLSGSGGRRLLQKEDGGGRWPEWLSAGDRRILQSRNVTPDVVVAADGSGNYTTVGEAVEAAPEKSDTRYVIRTKAGVYRENVEVGKKKTNIMFVGDGRGNTIITGSRNVQDGFTTFKSATVAVVGAGFLARDITIENTAGPSKHQAVALRVGSDLSAFYRCDVLAYQDTLYVHSNRQFFVQCLIAGTIDFIFGNSAAVFQDCDILARRPGPDQRNMVTAQGRKDPNQNTGIVIQNCRIGASSDLAPVQNSFQTFLGRPWKVYSLTVIMQSSIGDLVDPAGWHEWNGDFALDTLTYREYQNNGTGADTSKRVRWRGFSVITSVDEAQRYAAGNFIGGANWLGSTGFPFSLGL